MRNKRREWMGVIGAAGVVAALAGFVGGLMSVGVTLTLTFGIWILGAVLVQLLTDPPDRS